MRDRCTDTIRRAYRASAGDSSALFQAVVEAAGEMGIEAALGILEQCVLQKRARWMEETLPRFPRTVDPIQDAFRLFYLDYLHLTLPADGEIVDASSSRLVTRWWNPCPTLEACRQFGLDTRIVCRRAYHEPVQLMFSAIDPRLVFERSYPCLRPHAPYCEERIILLPIPRHP